MFFKYYRFSRQNITEITKSVLESVSTENVTAQEKEWSNFLHYRITESILIHRLYIYRKKYLFYFFYFFIFYIYILYLYIGNIGNIDNKYNKKWH